jgi:NitT/TauT family transport system ATP-binding protein
MSQYDTTESSEPTNGKESGDRREGARTDGPAGREPLVTLDGVSKVYDPGGDEVVALDDVDLEIEEDEFITVLGPSGCGKSTLLESIAGYLSPTEGEVRVDGERVEGPDPSRGVVFQENRLFPWKTIGQNAQFGPQMRGSVDESRIQRLLEVTGLDGFEDSYPHELSGGMQQRAELVRLLANDPKVMLMDEPFSGLDAMTKELMQELLLDIWEDENRTVLFITHDIEEAILLADRVVVMTARPGQIKDVIDVDLPRPRKLKMITTDAFNRHKERALELIHEEAERAMEQEREL